MVQVNQSVQSVYVFLKSKKMIFDLDIWHTGLTRYCLSQIQKTVSLVRVCGRKEAVPAVVGAKSSDGFLVLRMIVWRNIHIVNYGGDVIHGLSSN